MFTLSGKTSFLTKLGFVSTLTCKAMNNNIINNSDINSSNSSNNSSINNINEQETKYEKQFCEVLGKKYNKKNGNLELFRKASGIQCIESNKTLEFMINDVSYYIYIDKNQSNKFLDIFDNTGITSLTLFTAKNPIPSLINCNNLTKIQLSFDNDEDIKYLDDLLKSIKNVKNLQELDLRYLYYYWYSGYKKDILVIIDNLITSLKRKFPNLKYVYPNIYEKSKDYEFIDFKNKKEILDIVTLDCKNLFNNYKKTIAENLKTLSVSNTKIGGYIETVGSKLSESKEDLNKVNELIKSEEYLNEINKLKEKIKKYQNMLNSNLPDKEKSDVNEIISNLSRELNIMDRNNEKKYLEEQITSLEKEINDSSSFPSYVDKKIELLNKENSFIENIEKIINKNEYCNINIKEVYDFILKIKTKGENLEIIHPFGQECYTCLENIMIQDIIKDNIMKTPCNHIFHKGCLNTWLANNNSCPLCRGPINNNQ